jgi:hypothetical protein
MTTHAVPITSHTHFFTCVVTLSSIVDLCMWGSSLPRDEDALRQDIRLNIGALKNLGGVWKSASIASGQVKKVAQEIYASKKRQRLDEAEWGLASTQMDLHSSAAEDESLMEYISEFLTR